MQNRNFSGQVQRREAVWSHKIRHSWSQNCSGLTSVTVAKRPTQNVWGFRVEMGHVLRGNCQEREERGRGWGSLEPWVNLPFPLPSPPSHSLLSWWLSAGTRRNPGGKDCKELRSTTAAAAAAAVLTLVLLCRAAVDEGAGSGSGEGDNNHTGCRVSLCAAAMLAHLTTSLSVNRHCLPQKKA